ncbi:hypothetical protein L9F63_009877, partial [Diploptera punctata]
DFFKASLSECKSLMKRTRLKKFSRELILGALEVKWLYLRGFLTKENFQILPDESNLREDVQIDMFYDSLKKVPLFQVG